MNWNKGYSARYYIKTVDAATWRDIDTYNIISGSVSRSDGDLKETADLDLKNVPEGAEAWIRIYLDARQGSGGEREPIFTGLMQIPSGSWDGTRRHYSCECYSALKPAADVLLQRGWYVPAGFPGAKAAADLLRIGAAPVEYGDTSPALSTTIIAEEGETNLSMANKILDAINWRIRISGDGTISIEPKETEPRHKFDTLENDVVEFEVTDTLDLFNCPNVFRATRENMTAIARDDDPESPLSTVSRGREVWKDERNAKLNENESLAQYAYRRLREEQQPSRTVEYTRRYMPDVTIGDVVTLNLPAQGITGSFRVTSQKINLEYAGRTSEEAIAI